MLLPAIRAQGRRWSKRISISRRTSREIAVVLDVVALGTMLLDGDGTPGLNDLEHGRTYCSAFIRLGRSPDLRTEPGSKRQYYPALSALKTIAISALYPPADALRVA